MFVMPWPSLLILPLKTLEESNNIIPWGRSLGQKNETGEGGEKGIFFSPPPATFDSPQLVHFKIQHCGYALPPGGGTLNTFIPVLTPKSNPSITLL